MKITGMLRRIWCWVLLGFAAVASSATEEELLNRIEALRGEIEHHDDLYFRQAAPEITDYEYDLLKLELRRLERAAGLSPNEEAVGDDLAAGARRLAHGRPMLSLDKAYSEAEVAAFFERVTALSPDRPVRFSIEPKFDGVAVNVVLMRGEFQSAATRGNGEEGEDVTMQVRAIRGLDYEWAFDDSRPRLDRIELRGEVFLTHAAFARLNAERVASGQEPFSHPRSVAAGAIKLDNVDEVAARGLSLVLHGWGAVEPAAAAPASVMAFQRWLEARGLPAVADTGFVTPTSADELNAAIENVRARELPFPTDGVVIKVDDAALQAALGDGPTAPRWALARKFAPTRAATVLRDIGWQVGRTGTLTPVAEFDPVELAGTKIARASLHQPAAIVRRDLRLGDTVWIEKAGEIIPQLAGIDLEQRPAGALPYALPTQCPACATMLRIDETDKSRACPNRACPEQVMQRVLYFASRAAVGIRGLGPGLVEKLVTAGLVQTIPDLYRLTAEQLESLPGVGARTAERVLAAVAESRSAPLERVIVGLGLPGVGPAGARALAEQVNTLDDLLQPEGLADRLAVLGPAAAAAVEEALAEPATRAEIAAMAAQRHSN